MQWTKWYIVGPAILLLIGLVGWQLRNRYFVTPEETPSPPVAAKKEKSVQVGPADKPPPRPAAIKPVSPRPPTPLRTYAEQTGSFFSPAPANPNVPPEVTEIWIPSVADTAAIHGALGRDDSGQIWYAVSTDGAPDKTAHLFQFDPETSQSMHRGDVAAALVQNGMDADAANQSVIHTRIVQANDGNLYFASTGGDWLFDKASGPPAAGSHLWCLKLPEYQWQHLHKVPEGVVALSGVGRWVYALGHPGHVLYQLDTQTGQLQSVSIGSVAGHISSHILADQQGHVFVPRITSGDDDGPGQVTLVELDSALKEIGATPLDHYHQGDPAASWGITAFCYLADQSIAFATQLGHLYRIVRDDIGRADVISMGWLVGNSPSRASSLFAYDDDRFVVGTARLGTTYRWFVFDMLERNSHVMPFDMLDLIDPPRSDTLLGGSVTRDNSGNFYLVGSFRRATTRQPLMVQVQAGASSKVPGNLRLQR